MPPKEPDVHRTLVILLVLFPAPCVAAAQIQDSAQVASFAPGVTPGRRIRVAIPSEGRITGDVRTAGPAGLAIETASGPRTFATLPDTLWTRERAVGAGAIVGGIAGVGGGILLGLVANALCEYECGSAVADAALGAVVTGVAGAALGTLVGAAIPRWQRRLP